MDREGRRIAHARSLSGHRLHDSEKIFSTMIDLAHEEMDVRLKLLAFCQIVKVADNAEPTIWKVYALDLPVVRFLAIPVCAHPSHILGMMRLSCFEGVTKSRDDFASCGLMEVKFGHFCEISPEQWSYRAERLLNAGADLDHAEVSIDEINAKGIILNQAQIGVVALT